MLMKSRLTLVTIACLGTLLTLNMGAAPDKKNASSTNPPLPPGWTDEDMKAAILAGTPGEMHKHLNNSVGVWHGKNKMWMAPGAEPIESECTSTVSPVMEGRFTKCEMTGEMPGMGTYNGFGLYGFDNVSQKFSCTWVDNHGTGMMNGIGELSADGKVTTWNFTVNCPLTGKPTVVREIETITGPTTKTLEMYSTDPKSGKEYKMMSIDFTKK
jgi:hypothetical protein